MSGYPVEQANLNVSVPPYTYNPSAWGQRIPICLLAGVAFVIASYMSLYQWQLIDHVWDPIFGSQTQAVLGSDVAGWMDQIFGVPDAAIGALAYLGDAIFGLAGSTRRWQYRPWLVILFGIDVIPLGIVSAILVFCQATIVGNWCFLCLVTAVISLILVYMAFDEVYASLKYLNCVRRRSNDWSLVWSALWGRLDRQADEAAAAMLQRAT